MTANRVRVILTHAQVEAIRATVAESEGTLAATRRWGNAAEVTQARRRIHSAKAAVAAMDAAVAGQARRRQERQQARQAQPEPCPICGGVGEHDSRYHGPGPELTLDA